MVRVIVSFSVGYWWRMGGWKSQDVILTISHVMVRLPKSVLLALTVCK